MDHSHHALDSLGGLSEGRIVGLMGTDVRVVAWARTQEAATTAQEAAFEEMVRLQSIFSIYDPTSAISRWRRGEDFEVPDELTIALGQARHWFDQSGHAFHPASRALHARWQRAATEGVECRKDKDVIDETPAAYKDIDAVMAAEQDLVDVVHTLKQVVCVKG